MTLVEYFKKIETLAVVAYAQRIRADHMKFVAERAEKWAKDAECMNLRPQHGEVAKWAREQEADADKRSDKANAEWLALSSEWRRRTT